MASCKDCICSEVCYYKAFNDEKHLKKRRNDVEKICKSFVHSNSLKNAPTVDAVEVVHGRWIEKVDIVESYLADCTEVFYECSVCECANIGESPYCPNCGAKMDGGNEDE